ncbi:MAG: PAS domain-containing protein [Rickettsiales bacterium]
MHLELAKQFFEDLADPIILCSIKDGKYLYANKAYCKLSGYDKSQILERSVIDDDVKITADNFPEAKDVAIKHDPLIRITAIISSGGQEIPVEKSVKYIKHEEDEFFFVIVRDISSVKKLESDLLWMQEAIQTVSVGSSAGLWYWDIQNEKYLFSPSYKKMLGFPEDTSEEEINDYWLENIDATDKDAIFSDFRKSVQNKSKFSGEYKILARDGQYKWFYTSGEVIFDRNGKAIKMGGSAIDITALKKQANENEDLTNTLKLFRFLVESAPNPLVIVDEKDCILYANNSAHEKLHSFDKIELPLGDSIEFLTFKFSNINWQSIKNKVRSAQSARFECDFNDKQRGVSFALEVTVYKVVYKQRNCYCLILSDVSKRKQFEAEIQHNKDRFRMAAMASMDGIWEWRVDQELEYWSPRYYHLLGYNVGEIEPSFKNFINSVHPEDVQKVRSSINDHLKKKRPYRIEARIKVKNGEYHWFINQGYAEWDQENKPVRIVGILRSIHSRKIREQQVEAANKKLENMNRELEEFAYIASHDLKQPLQSIMHYSSFLIEDCAEKANADEMKMLQRIQEQSKYMEEMIKGLLAYAETSNKKKFAMVDIQKVIKDVSNSMEWIFKRDNVELKVGDDLPKMKCNEIMMTELIRNLISNGIKYNKSSKKKIAISYKSDSENHCISVKDNGIGIDPKHYKKVFMLFQRLHRREEYKGGTGFGLTLVKKIVKMHNGSIELKSSLGKGSEFKIYIPKNFEIGKIDPIDEESEI